MYDIKHPEILSKLEDLARQGSVIFNVYAFIPKRKRVRYNGLNYGAYKIEMVHERTKVYSTPEPDEVRKVYNEYREFMPAIEAKVYFD